MKTHPFRSMSEVRATVQARKVGNRFFVGSFEVFPIDQGPQDMLRRGTKALGYYNGVPLFWGGDFFDVPDPAYPDYDMDTWCDAFGVF